MVDVLGLSYSVTTTPTPTCDLLVIAASNGQNLLLAERFAAAAREQGQSAEVLDLTAIELPLFTPRAQAAGTPAALSVLQARLAASGRAGLQRRPWSATVIEPQPVNPLEPNGNGN